MEAGWLVIPFDRPVQVAACSIVGLASISTSHARHVSTNPVLEPLAAEVERLTRVEPAYETLPGWQKSLSHVRRLADLPPAARAYLDRLQDLAHAPIQYVSIGTRRDQIIEVT